MSKGNKTVAALHDIVGLGRCSLTMVIPVMAAMGILTCPVPTAVFSAHTQYPGFIKQPLDDFVQKTLAAYTRQGLTFDACYSGYLGNAGQIDSLKAFLDGQKGLRVVDPVFGDQGKLYASITMEMVEGMRGLIGSADIITPNATEAAYLLERPAAETLPLGEERAWLEGLSAFGPRSVLITSCQRDQASGRLAVLGMDEAGGAFRVLSPMLPQHFQGNGDLFASVLVGGMVNGLPLREAARQAAGFVCAAMEETIAAGTPPIEGVRVERSLSLLMSPQRYEAVVVEDL